nr:hypothetical protein BaRGS_030291 [Batillaria attramentaria]
MSGTVDLEARVKQWARDNGKRLHLKYAEKARVEVSWDRVKFTPVEPKWIRSNQCPSPPHVTIYKSTFQNNSDEETEHTLTMEKTTKATCSTTITKGYTTSLNFGLSLALPYEVATATFDFGREIKVDTANETVVEHDQTWSVDTKVSVPPRSRTTVKVEVKETRWRGAFVLPVTIKGMIVFSYYDQNTPGNFLGTAEVDVAELLTQMGAEQVETAAGTRKREVRWNLEGFSDFVFGVEQSVVVEPDALAY